MIDAEKLKTNIKQELETLRALREELRLKVSLAKADVRSDWSRLETRFELAQEELRRTQEHGKTALHEIETNLRTLIDELKRGYEAVRRSLQA